LVPIKTIPCGTPELNAQVPRLRLIPLSLKSATIPALKPFSRAARAYLWLFCRKFCGRVEVLGRGTPDCRFRATVGPWHRHKCKRFLNAVVIVNWPESR
jgi:hypothetical protein